MAVSRHMDTACLIILTIFLITLPVFAHSQPPLNHDGADTEESWKIINLAWNPFAATRIILNDSGADIRGGGAKQDGKQIIITRGGVYIFQGAWNDGGITVRAGKHEKAYILFNNASIHREGGAAVYIEQAERVIVGLPDESENLISCGAEFDEEFTGARIDGAIYSRCDLFISGAGKLSVSAPYRHGIVCNDYLIISGGVIEINAARDGIHVHDSARFSDMDLSINAGDDGITVSDEGIGGTLFIKSGRIRIPSCYEGLEAGQVMISGGEIEIYSRDDGINSRGGEPSMIEISGGNIALYNPDGADADGLDSNGDIFIRDGHVFISVNPDSHAVNYGIENGGVCEITGGVIAGFGGRLTAETFSDSSPQYVIFYLNGGGNADNSGDMNNINAGNIGDTDFIGGAGTAVVLSDAAHTPFISEWVPYAFDAAILSAPELDLNERYILSIGAEETEIIIRESSGVYENNQNQNLNPVIFGTGRTNAPDMADITANVTGIKDYVDIQS